jgi:hypothetical protein
MAKWCISMVAVLAIGSTAWATRVSVDGTTRLFDDYEAPDVVGAAPVANVGTWTSLGAGTTVRNAVPPGAAGGSQYLGIDGSSYVRYTLSPVASTNGTVVRLETMVYLPTAAQNQDHWYQMVWFNTSGTITGADNSPIHTSIAGNQLIYYNGTDYVTAGIPLSYGVWQKWVVEYTVGSGSWTITVDGNSMVMGLNSRSADVGIGTIQLFANGAAAGHPFFLDAAGTPITNDLCENAYAISADTVSGSTASATSDGTASCGSSNGSPDVWYSFTAPISGTATLDTCGSSFDTVLSVYAGACGALTELLCSDDCSGSPCGGTDACVTGPVTAGTTYLIRVSGKNGASGDYVLHAGVVPDCPPGPLPQTFDTTALGSPACWFVGNRTGGWFSPAPGGVAGVIDTDSISAPNSLAVIGTGQAGSMHAWRDYNGLSSDGVNPITVSFDLKLVNYAANLAITPFCFNAALWGTAGTPASGYGWPVNTNYGTDNSVTYYEDGGNLYTLLPSIPRGEWFHYVATLYPATRTADVAVTVLTGATAGWTGGVRAKQFQYGTTESPPYYDASLDELRGVGFFTPGGQAFDTSDQLLIDNYDVQLGTPPALPPPPNDACANATVISGGPTFGRTIGATNDGSSSCADSSASPDVWYRYTATCTGDLLIKACAQGFNMVVSVHADSCSGAELACSTTCGGTGIDPCGAMQQCLSVPVTSGATYLIRVSGANGESGYFGLDVACAQVASNDDCANATAISDGTFTGSTLLATNDGDASCGDSGTSPDVWFAYTATCNGTASFDTFGSAFNTVLSIHDDTMCPGSFLNELACNDDSGGPQSAVSLAVTQGTTYLIRIAGNKGATGEYALNVSCVNPCPNPALPQNFDGDPLGSPACWHTGPRFFGDTPRLAAVTDADALSAPNSLRVTGNGSNMHTYRDYGGQSSDGVKPVTVSFDMKVVNFVENIAITPFVFDAALYGSAGVPHPDPFGWPVSTNYDPSGEFTYTEDGVNLTILSVPRADVNDQWFRYTATLDTATRLTDVTVEILTGPAAGQKGTLTGKKVQYDAAGDYYGDAMDELRGFGFFTPGGVPFGPSDDVLIDNFNVVIGSTCHHPPTDADGDGDVDLSDFLVFQSCFNGPNRPYAVADPSCRCLDTQPAPNGDADVDLADFLVFQGCFNGPNRAPACP